MRAKVLECVYSAIAEVNLQLPAGEQLAASEETVLAGSGGTLDSLTLLTLIASAERHVDEGFKISSSLASEMMESEELPATVGQLADRIVRIVEGGAGRG